jgi:hypothetical protein
VPLSALSSIDAFKLCTFNMTPLRVAIVVATLCACCDTLVAQASDPQQSGAVNTEHGATIPTAPLEDAPLVVDAMREIGACATAYIEPALGDSWRLRTVALHHASHLDAMLSLTATVEASTEASVAEAVSSRKDGALAAAVVGGLDALMHFVHIDAAHLHLTRKPTMFWVRRSGCRQCCRWPCCVVTVATVVRRCR